MATRQQKRNERANRIVRDLSRLNFYDAMGKYRFLTNPDLETGVVVSEEEKYTYILLADRTISRIETARFNYSSANLEDRADLIKALTKNARAKP